MQVMENDIINPLLKSGNVFKLICKSCKSISVQITENNTPDYICLECEGKCILFREYIADK